MSCRGISRGESAMRVWGGEAYLGTRRRAGGDPAGGPPALRWATISRMKHAILAVAVVFAAARCATMVNTATEKIPVRSNPAGAVVTVDCGNAPLYGGV